MRKAILILLSVFATANLNAGGLDDMIDDGLQSLKNDSWSMSNTTSGSSSSGNAQRRGYISGGSASYRGRLFSENIVQFSPPSISAGCSGIDVFGGSFSMISKEQMKQLLRSIAQNSTTYAFQLAMDGMCPTCNTLISKLQDQIQKMNSYMGDSCQAAQALVDGLNKNGAITNSLSAVNTAAGAVDDWFSGRNTDDSGTPEQKKNDNAASVERFNKELAGNVVWRVLNDSTNWGSYGFASDTALKEAIMSITGTVIISGEADEESKEQTKLRVHAGTLELRDLLTGSKEPSSGSSAERKLDVLVCDTTEADGCLRPTKAADGMHLKGFNQRVIEILLGNGSSPGLVEKFSTGQGTLTAEERAFIELAPGGIGAMIRNLSKEGEGAAVAFARGAAERIAFDYALTLVLDTLKLVERALTAEKSVIAASEARKMIATKRSDVLEWAAGQESRLGSLADIHGHYLDMARMRGSRIYFSSAKGN